MAKLTKFEWREGTRHSLDPNVVGDIMRRIAARIGRPFSGVTAEDLLEEASDPESPIHAAFNWDDATAAHAHRLHQARMLVNGIRHRVIKQGVLRIERSFPSVVVNGVSMYVPRTVAEHNEDLRAQTLAAAKKGLEGWRNHYEDYAGIAPALPHIDAAMAAIDQAATAAAKTKPAAKAKKRARSAATAG